MSKKLIFKVVAGNLSGDEFIFEDQGAYIIGRSKNCALQIPNDKDMRISRRHLLLLLDQENARIRDLGSKNGTLVNGTKIPPGTLTEPPGIETPVDQILKPGDEISIGETTWKVELPSTTEEEVIPLVDSTPLIKESPAPPPMTEASAEESPETQISPEPEDTIQKEEPPHPTPLPPQTQVSDSTLKLAQINKGKKIDLPIKSPSTLKIKEKKPPVPVPTNLKVLPPTTPKGKISAPPPPVLEPELPTIIMDQEELDTLENIDDTKFKPPEKKRQTNFTLKPLKK